MCVCVYKYTHIYYLCTCIFLALPPFNREELLCESLSRGGGQFL